MEDYNCCCYQGINKDLSQILVPWNEVWGGEEGLGSAGNSGETGLCGQDLMSPRGAQSSCLYLSKAETIE